MLMQPQQEGPSFKLQNPFTLRVGQVFTGFGVGCGIGIGVGRAINLRAVPVLGSVAGEAIGSFSSLKPHVDSLGKKLGIKNIQAGVGCGVGIGHGFGIGITLKPGAVQQLKHLLEQAYSTVSERFKSLTGSSDFEDGSGSDESRNAVIQGKILPDIASPTGSTTMQSLGNLLQNTTIATTKTQFTQESHSGEVNRLETENRILLTLLNHQEQIELLRKENATLKQALKEVDKSSLDLKASADEADHSVQERLFKSRTKCFECRRRAWQRR